MKSLFNVCLLTALVAANNISVADVFDVLPELVTLEEVYGSVAHGSAAKRAQHMQMRSPNYYRSRNPENCTFPLEIVILQDNTASFQDDFDEMRNVQLDLMVNALSVGHPDSKYAVVSFRDKPVYSLGEPAAGDYCLRFEAPLSANVSALKAAYDTLESNGGADPAESQFTAIVAAAQSATPGWSTGAFGSGDEPTRVIVMATDAPPHFADDGLNFYGMRRFSGEFDEANADTQCLAEYYPDPAQVQSALTARDAYLAVLVYDGSWWNELPHKSWLWLNSYLGQSSEFVTSLTADSSNFWSNLNHAILAVEQLECIYTSTVAPTLLPPATATLPPPPPCPPCSAPPCRCAAPAVEILLRHRPSHLKLLVENGKFNRTSDVENI